MDGTTGIVLAVVFGLVTLVLGILNYVNKRNGCDNDKIVKQTELQVKLVNIEKELAEIKSLLVASNIKYESLDKRVFILENNEKVKKGE